MRGLTFTIISLFLIVVPASLKGQDNPPADSVLIDTAITFTDAIDSASIDSVFEADEEPVEIPPLPSPINLLDSLSNYFISNWHSFDVQSKDIYPRNAAGFLESQTSYFVQTNHETPQRTTVTPYGIHGGVVSVRSGLVIARPFDRVVPADGMTDFDDIATGDVAAAGIIEGPLSAYDNLNGGLSTLYLKPIEIPEGPAESEFIVERGAFGYAYTRGRIARQFSKKLGMSFSTDYRNGEGFRFNSKDNSYIVKTRIRYKPYLRTTLDLYLNIYRREGDFQVMPDSGGFVFNRIRRDQQFTAVINQQEFLNGQLTGRLEYQSSRSQYTSTSTSFYRTVRPHYYNTKISYLRSMGEAVYELSLEAGRTTVDVNDVFLNGNYSAMSLSVFNPFMAGKLFTTLQVKNSEYDHPVYDAVSGYSVDLSTRAKAQIAVGYVSQTPDLLDRYAPSRMGPIGSAGSLARAFMERGNPGLQPEKRFYGNATIAFQTGKGLVSLSLNAGKIDNAIYYDRRYTSYPAGEVFPANDQIKFADANLRIEFDNLGPFYTTVSGTYRKVDSDRYGNRPPYSPRWQTFGQLGLKYYTAKFDIYTRAYGELVFYDKPLSHKLKELETGALINWGLNASMQSFTFYYKMHNGLNQIHETPEGYGYTGWYYSWGVNWKFLD
ncbi:MAG: hypothetical protein KAR42_06915 [candidate division Zixibacteria bacterium]|nr:hypothetical protein [candidate division Zixibacteria bacterium]